MQKYTRSQMQKMLLTIAHVTIAAISTHPIESIDVDVVITPAQAQVHWHWELNKKHVRGGQQN
jgi:hypothetical protein